MIAHGPALFLAFLTIFFPLAYFVMWLIYLFTRDSY